VTCAAKAGYDAAQARYESELEGGEARHAGDRDQPSPGGPGGPDALPGRAGRVRGVGRVLTRPYINNVPCFCPSKLFNRPITFEWIWQTRLSVSASISPISRIVWPTV